MRSEAPPRKVSDIAEINPSRRVRKGVPVPFVDMAALPTNGRDINVADVVRRPAKSAGAHFKNGDTLLARITPCLENGKTAQVRCLADDEVAEGSTEFKVLAGRNDQDNDYVYYLCREPTFREFVIKRMEGSSGRQRVPWQAVGQFTFDFPSIADRVSAAGLLSLLDDRIRLLSQTSTTLQTIAQALFKSWFVDFDPARAKAEGREPEGMDAATAALFPSEFEESELGQIPAGWRVDAIGSVVRCVGGATPSTKEAKHWDRPVHHWVTPKDLSGAQAPVLIDTDRKISDAGLARISSGLLPVGSVLLSSRAPIGYLAVTDIPTAINQGFIALLPGGQLPASYLLFWTQANMDVIKQKANGSTFMEISKSAFRPIAVVVPSQPVIDTFDALAAPLLERIAANERHRLRLVELRDTLLPRLISGQLRLPDAQVLAADAA